MKLAALAALASWQLTFASKSGVSAKVGKSKAMVQELPPDPERIALPAVPGVANAGKDGYPELPGLDQILDPSSKAMMGITSQAQELEAKMLRVEKENALRLQRQKSVFDRKLKEQEDKNQASMKSNAKLASAIMEMKKGSEGVFAQTTALQKANSVRRQELKSIQDQLSAVQKFISEALAGSDESQAPELGVLRAEEENRKELSLLDRAKQRAAAAEESENSEDARDGEESQDKPLSFLMVDEEFMQESAEESGDADSPADKEPESLLSVLAENVRDMNHQGEASESKLKSLFLNSFQAGVKRHKALQDQSTVLESTMKTMETYKGKLDKAQKRLQDTQAFLDKNIHGTGLFLKKLSQVSLAKPEEAAATLAALQPKS